MLEDVLVVIAAFAAGAATVYYFGVYRKKQQLKQQQVQAPVTPGVHPASTQHAPSFRSI